MGKDRPRIGYIQRILMCKIGNVWLNTNEKRGLRLSNPLLN